MEIHKEYKIMYRPVTDKESRGWWDYCDDGEYFSSLEAAKEYLDDMDWMYPDERGLYKFRFEVREISDWQPVSL